MKHNKQYKLISGGAVGCNVITLVIILLINIVAGAWASNEILSWFGKNIPTFWDCIIGLITGEISIPIAIVGKILLVLGVF